MPPIPKRRAGAGDDDCACRSLRQAQGERARTLGVVRAGGHFQHRAGSQAGEVRAGVAGAARARCRLRDRRRRDHRGAPRRQGFGARPLPRPPPSRARQRSDRRRRDRLCRGRRRGPPLSRRHVQHRAQPVRPHLRPASRARGAGDAAGVEARRPPGLLGVAPGTLRRAPIRAYWRAMRRRRRRAPSNQHRRRRGATPTSSVSDSAARWPICCSSATPWSSPVSARSTPASRRRKP